MIAYGRDRAKYDRYGDTVSNWATAEGGFDFDTRFGSEALSEQVKIHPPDGSVIRERRPFVLLEFPEATSVNLTSVVFDGAKRSAASSMPSRTTNSFTRPLSMNQGQHTVEVKARDSAGNVGPNSNSASRRPSEAISYYHWSPDGTRFLFLPIRIDPLD